ncbi:hypothetical protein F5880DRAFT_1559344 [Lentinula raphanica]|nr:hypothetical protein F5880DRAFT_1559344 [Lentinula raphanica]
MIAALLFLCGDTFVSFSSCLNPTIFSLLDSSHSLRTLIPVVSSLFILCSITYLSKK